MLWQKLHDVKALNMRLSWLKPSMSRKVILVTGGAGFIGSNLCQHFLDTTDHQVICVDNLFSGSHMLTHPRYTLIQQDVCQLSLDFIEHIDEIYHLACPASPKYYQQNPMKTIKTCVFGTYRILKLCKRFRCKLLFTSTSEVYGDAEITPQHEDYWGNVNPIGIRACYDESKRLCETMITEYRRKHNLDLKIVRIFNTYGPQMNPLDGRIIPAILSAVRTNSAIEVYGNGLQTRSLCFIDDLLRGLCLMMASAESGPINLGNPHEECTINEVISLAEDLFQHKIERINRPLPQNDPRQRRPDITKAQRLLNWSPQISLKDGLLKLRACA